MKLNRMCVLAAVFIAGASSAQAGCLSGAAVGGVAGHFAGHHGVIGAVAGCAIGHHQAKKARMQQQQNDVPPADQQNRM